MIKDKQGWPEMEKVSLNRQTSIIDAMIGTILINIVVLQLLMNKPKLVTTIVGLLSLVLLVNTIAPVALAQTSGNMTGDVNQAIKSAMPNSPKLPVSNAQVFVVICISPDSCTAYDLKALPAALWLKQVVI